MTASERIVYVDGHYCPESEGKVSIFDRGYLFADAIYEVTCVIGGKLVDFDGHMVRLQRSLKELDMPVPMSNEDLLAIHRKLVADNNVDEGLIYMQISRGNADRDFNFPSKDTPPVVVMFTQARPVLESPLAKRGLKVISLPDMRWGRRDIKTVQLLYPSMAKNAANEVGADDAWLVQDGFVTEASSANAYIVTTDGKIVTRSLSTDILHGITRAAVLRFAQEAGYVLEERSFTIAEALEAQEALITSATSFVTSVLSIDGQMIGDGKIGPVSSRLREIYIDKAVGARI
ncbi:D-amino-acid transaminase [Rhizobium sp. CF142]|uniref:D-amino-acid transaminase n=1 Tax=Rhizobium sp. CF142 TaxID=1144314 RepID=UPI00026EFF38|nr:D-amino-acid transaminase [Rhizobium sp. CF142]EJJ28100.1 branched-chain amino acid aminotransferase/4-amino-4-deoxychorismate lyase [Rhizobium sp. CF142]